MLYRTAWIALFGCGLLCYLVLANGSLNEARAKQTSRFAGGSPEDDTCPDTNQESVDRNVDIPAVRSIGQGIRNVEIGTTQDPAVDIANASRQAAAARPTTAAPSRHLTDWSHAPVQWVSYSTGSGDGTESRDVHWPAASTLIEQIKNLQHLPEVQDWAQKTIALLESLTQLDPDSQALGQCLAGLESQVQAVPQLATAIGRRGSSSIDTMRAYCEVSRLSYRLQRRIAVWSALGTAARQTGNQQRGVFHSFRSGSTIQPASISRISFENLDPSWVEYLKLSELQSAFGSLNPNEIEQKKVARSVLARIYSPVLKPDQAAFIQQVIDPTIIGFLKEQATGNFAEAELLKRIEDYESQSTSQASYYLNDQFQNLLWSANPNDQALATEIQTHYRNANLRFVVSERLMNRMIPKMPNTAAPVNQHIKGARVSGQSQISNRLRVELMPNQDQIELLLATTGDVQSDTIAKTKSFRIQNLGKARFQVVQRVTINPEGIDSSSDPQALSEASQYVVGVESKMDNLPVVGWMARKLATKKLREEAPDNNRIFKRTIESSAEKKMRQQVNQQVAKIRYATYTKLFLPLFNLDLDPTPMQMSTTEKQVVLRYRLAGQDQMAANTSRPRDSGDSLLSFQLHQSAINNLIARIGLSGREFTIDELSNHLRDVAGLEPTNEAQPSDQYAEIEFAPFDPIHIDFSEDRITISLKMKSLKVGESGKVWKYLTLTAKYRFVIDGMNIRLIQDDDGTLIRGSKLRISDRAAISTVMKVLFKQEYSLNSLPKQIRDKLDVTTLQVSQLVASDGWMAVSIDDQDKSLARREEAAQQRSSTIRRLIQRR